MGKNVLVECTKCKTKFYRPFYNNKGRKKKEKTKPRVESRCYICGGGVKRLE